MSRGLTHERPHGGETVEWYTPPAIFDRLGLRFDLDPCSPPGGLPWVRWFHETVGCADAVCFVQGRISFVAGDGREVTNNAAAPSCLVAYGQECAAAVAASGLGMTFSVRARPMVGQASLWETDIRHPE